MARLTPIYTSIKTITITYRTPQETLLSTPETLPTSEPTTPQISYTVTQNDLPEIAPQPRSVTYVALMYGAGKFTTAGTIYYRMRRNGSSVYSGNASVSANYYYTVNTFFFGVNVGDVLELSLWSSVSDSNWDYKAFQIQITRMIPVKARMLTPCGFSVTPQPVLTLGNPLVSATGNLRTYNSDAQSQDISTTTTYSCVYVGNTYGLFRLGNGDVTYSNQGNILTSSTRRPYYRRNQALENISFRSLTV